MKRIKIAFSSVALMCIAALVMIFSGCTESPQTACQVCEDCDQAVSDARQEDWRAVSDWIGKAAQRYYAASQQAILYDSKACDQLSQRYLDLTSLRSNLWIQAQTGNLASCKTCGDDLVALLTSDLAPAPDQRGDQSPEEELGGPLEHEPTGGPPRAAQ